MMVLLIIRKGILTDLTISHADQPFIYQFVCLGVSGLSLHDVTFCLLIRQRNCRNLQSGKQVLDTTSKAMFLHENILSMPYHNTSACLTKFH